MTLLAASLQTDMSAKASWAALITPGTHACLIFRLFVTRGRNPAPTAANTLDLVSASTIRPKFASRVVLSFARCASGIRENTIDRVSGEQSGLDVALMLQEFTQSPSTIQLGLIIPPMQRIGLSSV